MGAGKDGEGVSDMKRLLLDTFCKAGGCTKGYQRAGFYVVGVDIEPQKNYCGDEFFQGDALEFIAKRGHEFDAIHASPPCQRYCAMTKRWKGVPETHPDLIAPTRDLLAITRKPFVIENVAGSPLRNPVLLCGTMFGLQTSFGSQLRRHRLFECNWELNPPGACAHNDGSAIGVYGGGQHPNRRVPATVGVYGSTGPGAYSTRDGTCGFSVVERREAMGIDWMSGKELSQAIPPAYTEFIGRELMTYLECSK